jgi:hypothetical protein
MLAGNGISLRAQIGNGASTFRILGRDKGFEPLIYNP